MTKDVEVLLGNPKKAILAMAIPTTIALVAQSVTNLTDAMWVSGLGTDALAAVGIVFPLFFIMVGIGQGIGIGAAAAISKRIGADNKADADRTAAQAVAYMIVASVIVTIVLLIFLEPILRFLGTGASEETIQQCLRFARPMVMFTIVFLAVGVMSNVIRSEGAAKRSMYVVIMVAVINLIIEPFFIYDYGLGWGMTGASLATIVAEAAGIMVIIYWYIIKKDLFLKFRFRGFRFDRLIAKDIFSVGIPAAFQMIVISLVSIFMLRILLMAGGDDGVAIYSSDWRIISILTIPVMGIAMGIVPVCAAALGAERYDKIKDAYNYALKISISLMVVVMIITIIFAPQMNMAFTYSADTEHLRGGMTDFLRIAALFLPFFAMGNCAESLFQSLGMGVRSLTSTIFRNFLMIPLCYAAAVLTSGLTYIWWGASFAEIIASGLVLIWSFYVLRGFIRRRSGIDRKPSEACSN
ncbi:multidrug resistance protein MdtK [Candidatus Methanoplasma termitum]|uniref:MdtK protein n=2 Tax=Candidatus Methanoplasma termitum TaxID=1577791 RepID=A0A0A7LD57_9ARCH|nr:multidrug resistance protein MdtK [Candidatus Methanoplasma termitum]